MFAGASPDLMLRTFHYIGNTRAKCCGYNNVKFLIFREISNELGANKQAKGGLR